MGLHTAPVKGILTASGVIFLGKSCKCTPQAEWEVIFEEIYAGRGRIAESELLI